MALLLALPVISSQSHLHAASATWTGVTDGTFGVASNWNVATPGNLTPSATADVATFANGTNTAITIDGNRALGAIRFDAGAGAFIFGGGPLYLSNTTAANAGITIASGVTAAQRFNSAIKAGGNALFFDSSSSTASATLTLGDITGSSTANTVVTLRGGNTGENTVAGTIADGVGYVTSLVKTNGGKWILSGNNTFTGDVDIKTGKLELSNLASLGGGTSAVTLGGGGRATFSYTGSSATFTRGFTMAWSGDQTIEVTTEGQTLTIAGGNIVGPDSTNVLSFTGAGNIDVTSSIQVKNLAKSGTGTLTLSGSNAFSGDTSAGSLTVRAGTVVLNSDNALGKNARLSLQGAGNVVQAGGADRVFSNGLDFGSGFSTTFSGSNSLTFTGGVNFDAGTTSGGFNNRLDPGKLLTISGTINMSNGAAANDFRITAIGDSLISGNIIGGLNSSVTFHQGAGIVTFSGSNSYTGATTVGAGGAAPTLVLASDHALAGGGLLVFNRGIVQAGGGDRAFANTIDLATSAGGTIIAAFSGSHSLTFTNGMTVTGATGSKQVALTNDIVPGKRLTISGPISASASGNDNTLTIGGSGETWITGDISNGGGTNTRLRLIGTGITVLSGSNSYSGATTLAGQNTLRLAGSNALGTGSLIFGLGGRGLVELSAGNSLFTRALGTGQGQVAWEEASGGFGAYGADATVNIGGAGASYIWGSTTNFLRTYQRLLLSSVTSDHKVTWVNGIDLNGLQRTLEVSNGSALVDADVSGVITGRAGSALQKVGAGTLELSGANTYIGATLIEEGVLRVSSVDISGGSSNIGSSGNVQLGTTSSSGRLDYVGLSGTLNGALSVKEGGGRIDTVTAGQTLTIATAGNTVALTGTLTVGGAGNTVMKSDLGSGAGGLVKTGSGTLSIAGNNNNYTGTTTVTMGRLLVSGSLTQTLGVSVASGATLTVDGFINTSANVTVNGVLNGRGRLGTIGGSGLVGPGNSPGILTATATDSKDGLDYAFEFTGTGSPNYGNSSASVNDILRLTGETPFTTALGANNSVAIYLNVGSLSLGDSFRGGFYTDNDASFFDQIENAAFTFYLFNPEGEVTYNEVNYDLYGGLLTFKIDTVREMANFDGGPVYGYVSEFTVVPEPGSAVLWIAGLGLTLGWIGRTRRVNG